MSGKRQASLINCPWQVYEAILFHTKDLGEKIRGDVEEENRKVVVSSLVFYWGLVH